MTQSESHYFALLRSALWDTSVAIDGPIDWDAVVRLAKHHATLALVCGPASMMNGDNRPDEALLGKMQMVMRNNLLNQLRMKQILASAVTLLHQHNIESVLLKGFGLAMLYPNPNLRQFGDIDLFVGLDDFHEACQLLRTLPGGYNWGEEVDSGRHYNMEFGQYPMEIHRISADVGDPKESKAYAGFEREGLIEKPQHVNLEGLDVCVPSKEFMVFYTFYHAWHHFLNSGVGWRQISDVAMTLHAYHGQLDLDKLHQWLDTMHLMKPWQAFGYLMVEHLGLAQGEMPFYDVSSRRVAQRLYHNVMEVGNFSRNSWFKQHIPKRKLFRKVHSLLSVFVDFFYRVRIFPMVAFREMGASWKQMLGKAMKKDNVR